MSDLRIAIVCIVAMSAIAGAVRADDVTGEAFFENRIRPVLAGVCVALSRPTEAKRRTATRFASRARKRRRQRTSD